MFSSLWAVGIRNGDRIISDKGHKVRLQRVPERELPTVNTDAFKRRFKIEQMAWYNI